MSPARTASPTWPSASTSSTRRRCGPRRSASPRITLIISITRGIHASNKVRGPSRTKEALPFGNLAFGSPSLYRELCGRRLCQVSLHAAGWRFTFTKRLKPRLYVLFGLPMLAIRPAGCILGQESHSQHRRHDFRTIGGRKPSRRLCALARACAVQFGVHLGVVASLPASCAPI